MHTDAKMLYARNRPKQPLPQKGAATGSIIGGIIGAILVLALIATAVILIRKQCCNKDGPPTYKPPPPVKHSKIPDTMTYTEDTHSPLTYYETQNAEPVTDLDSYHGEDEDLPSQLDHKIPNSWEERDMQPPYYDHRELDGQGQLHLPSNLARGDSFVSDPINV
ncbi:nectin-2-like [Trichomycterus rosablanca]|uniref:nectin-2-like n=1 Tax=Trichomycterus rosablanca TaxID=2290929 RepID=UPI002F35E552